jgi:2-polyprenyl-6-methoxyphenol hydroxylase-like FAD-dependent oxidoreductase
VTVTPESAYDVIVIGGGMAGSSLGGVLARAGLSVLIIEKVRSFRDRIRGEFTWPWGVAEIERAGLRAMLGLAECVPIEALRVIEDRAIKDVYEFAPDSPGGVPALGYSHPRLQQVALDWAVECGATLLRPARATHFSALNGPAVTIVQDDREMEARARLVVGADGRQSGVRRWTGGQTETDPEHHRIGGVLTRGVRWDPHTLDVGPRQWMNVFWFSTSDDLTRVYIATMRDRLQKLGLSGSFDRIAAQLAEVMPEGAVENLQQAGPIGFFSNANTWSTRLASDHVVLIGDAAGASDPSRGMGTSLVFRDVRELSELLLAEHDWPAALAEFERRRWRYYRTIREHDRWRAMLSFEEGPEADLRRECHRRALEQDPTLGGFTLLESRGPDDLIADETSRRMFFGEDLQ